MKVTTNQKKVPIQTWHLNFTIPKTMKAEEILKEWIKENKIKKGTKLQVMSSKEIIVFSVK
jgi:hypothetical protein